MNLSPLPVQKFFSNIGLPLVGGKLFTYVAGTSTKIATYQDSSGTLNTNPIILNFRGEANIWLDPELTYKFVLSGPFDSDPPANPIWTVDNIAAGLTINEFTRDFIGRILYPRTTAEIAAGVTPVHYYYPPLNVLRYGADDSGATSSTDAFDDAMDVLAQMDGGTIVVPAGLYKLNLLITGQNIQFVCEDWWHGQTGQVGFIADVSTDPVVQIGDGTATTRNVSFFRFSIIGTSGADKGIFINGADGITFMYGAVRNFDEYQIRVTSSATRPSFNNHFWGVTVSNSTTTGSLGVLMQYGASFTTFLDFHGCYFVAAVGGDYMFDLDANSNISFIGGYADVQADAGFHVRSVTCEIHGSGFRLDSGSSDDVLALFDGFNARVPVIFRGDWTCDGKVEMAGGTTDRLGNRFFIPKDTLLDQPHVQGALSLQDSTDPEWEQEGTGNQPSRMAAQSGTFLIIADDGSVDLRPKTGTNFVNCVTGPLRLMSAAISGGAGNVVFGNATQTTVGAAGGASALPATPTGYLRLFVGSTEFVIPYYARA